MKKDFLYKPILEPERKYDSDIDFQTEEIYREEIKTQVNPKVPLMNGIKELEKNIEFLPEDIKKAIEEMIKGLKYAIATINPTNEKKKAYSKKINQTQKPIKEPIDKDYSTEDIDDYIVNIIDPQITENITIEIEKIDMSDIIKEEFNNTSASLIYMYIKRLREAIREYTVNLFSLMKATKDIPAINLNYNILNDTSKIRSYANKSVSDTMIKNNIKRDQKLRVYSKIFNKEGLQKHLRSCKISAELKDRYSKAKYESNKDFSSVVVNNILAQSRKEYDEKYDSNFLNFYKYLDSSINVVKECLDMALEESQSKLILISREGTPTVAQPIKSSDVIGSALPEGVTDLTGTDLETELV